MKNILYTLAICLIAISCKSKVPTQESASEAKCPNAVAVTVIDSKDIDGCDFILRVNDTGELLSPISFENVQQEIVENAQLKIEYRPLKIMNTCMRGTPVEITCSE